MEEPKKEVFNNLRIHPRRRKKRLTPAIADEVVSCIHSAMKSANGQFHTYAPSQLESYLRYVNQQDIINRVNTGFLLLVRNSESALIACGLIGHHYNHPEISEVHIKAKYRGRRYDDGRKISDIIMDDLEERILDLNCSESRLYALKFPRTLGFYERRGYVPAKEEGAPLPEWVRRAPSWVTPMVKRLTIPEQ
jgi:GNAT superfamily N-acetyltransferase